MKSAVYTFTTIRNRRVNKTPLSRLTCLVISALCHVILALIARLSFISLSAVRVYLPSCTRAFFSVFLVVLAARVITACIFRASTLLAGDGEGIWTAKIPASAILQVLLYGRTFGGSDLT